MNLLAEVQCLSLFLCCSAMGLLCASELCTVLGKDTGKTHVHAPYYGA
jgi:hypothetical protein